MAKDNEKETPVSKFHPEFDALEAKLQAERDAIVAESKPLRDARDKLADSIRPTEDKIRELNMAIKAIEQPALANIDNTLGAIAKAKGGRSVQADAPDTPAAEE